MFLLMSRSSGSEHQSAAANEAADNDINKGTFYTKAKIKSFLLLPDNRNQDIWMSSLTDFSLTDKDNRRRNAATPLTIVRAVHSRSKQVNICCALLTHKIILVLVLDLNVGSFRFHHSWSVLRELCSPAGAVLIQLSLFLIYRDVKTFLVFWGHAQLLVPSINQNAISTVAHPADAHQNSQVIVCKMTIVTLTLSTTTHQVISMFVDLL